VVRVSLRLLVSWLSVQDLGSAFSICLLPFLKNATIIFLVSAQMALKSTKQKPLALIAFGIMFGNFTEVTIPL
jgi:hypothetical protein